MNVINLIFFFQSFPLGRLFWQVILKCTFLPAKLNSDFFVQFILIMHVLNISLHIFIFAEGKTEVVKMSFALLLSVFYR